MAEESEQYKSEITKELSAVDDFAQTEIFRKLVECPVCLEIPFPPIYVCHRGHIVCNSCRDQINACPLCKSKYSVTRAFVAEGIIEKAKLPCKYVDNGCPLTMCGAVLVEHVEVCDYRPVQCADCSGKLIEFIDYEDHLLKHHGINGINKSRTHVVYVINELTSEKNCHWPQYYLKAFDSTFLLRMLANKWLVCVWVSLLGPKTDCSKFDALLELYPPGFETIKHSWSGQVNYFRDCRFIDIQVENRGLIIPRKAWIHQTPLMVDENWLCTVTIKKRMEDSLNTADKAIEGAMWRHVNPTEAQLTNKNDSRDEKECKTDVGYQNDEIFNDSQTPAVDITTSATLSYAGAKVDSIESQVTFFATDTPQRSTSDTSSNKATRSKLMASTETPRITRLQ